MNSTLKSIVVIFYLLVPLFITGQHSGNFLAVDTLTYNSYINQDWSRLITVGDRALNNGIDYYYLRMRLGIASYEQRKYTKSVKHLRKALDFNFNEPNAQLQLYNSYLFLGKNNLARQLRGKFSENTEKLVTKNNPVFSSIEIGGGKVFSDNLEKNSDFVTGSNNDTIPGFEVQIGNKYVIYALTGINISPSISYTLGFNYLEIEKRAAFQFVDVSLNLDSVSIENWGYQNYYSVKLENKRKYFDNSIFQNELYQNIRFQLNNYWAVSLFGNLIFVDTKRVQIQSDSNRISRVNYQVTDQQPVFFDFTYDSVYFIESDSSFVDYVIGFNLEKDLGGVSLNLISTYSSLNKTNQFQTGLSSYYFLLPSADFYGLSTVYFFYQERLSGATDTDIILIQKLGGKLIKKLWGEVNFTYGIIPNSNLGNGYFIYNQVDNVKYKAGMKLKWIFNENLSLSLYYNYAKYEGSFYRFATDGGEAEVIPRYYESNNLIGGLTWNF